MKYKDNGQWKDIKIKPFDTLPINSIVEYDGATVPEGYVAIANPDYSTSEVKTGETWIDGKPIYRKTINFGALPNATEKSVNHNISNIGNVLHIYGYAKSSSSMIPLPYPDQSATGNVGILATTSIVKAFTAGNKSSYTTSYITLEYTKTTD